MFRQFINVAVKRHAKCAFRPRRHQISIVTLLNSSERPEAENNFKNITEAEWFDRLTPEEFSVCRKAGTESPGSGLYDNHYENGTYSCVCCKNQLFSSETKFKSGSGWPSFYAAMPGALQEKEDLSHGMKRVEILCSKCDAHLGHVFEDGPPPTGKRFCINSVCLKFEPST